MDVHFILSSLGIVLILATCKAVLQCSTRIPHGLVESFCTRLCSYSCDYGYVKNVNVRYLKCSRLGYWKSGSASTTFGSASDLCIPKHCRSTIPNGNFSTTCPRKVGQKCSYTCNSGYQNGTADSTVTCLNSTIWSVDPHTLCTNNEQCPLFDLPHGSLLLTCQRRPGEICYFECHKNYQSSQWPESRKIRCTSNSTWDKNVSELCDKNIQCPSTVPNGYITSACTREPNSHCYSYNCDNDYEFPTSLPSHLLCNSSGQWVWDTTSVPKLCLRQPNCSSNILHGLVETGCIYGCLYSCDYGYVKNSLVSRLKCSRDDNWVASYSTQSFDRVSDLCIPKVCPSTIPNGNLSSTCPGKVGQICDYTCNHGYRNETGDSTITCQNSANWSVDPHTLCTSDEQCPLFHLPHGELPLSCQRRPGEVCHFECHKNYQSSQWPESRKIRCTSNSTWDKNVSALCDKKIQCPLKIPNGFPSYSCSREPNSYCYFYYCDNGYQYPRYKPNLRCNASGHWEWNSYYDLHYTEKLCLGEEDLCPNNISNGRLRSSCKRRPDEYCSFSCDNGCKRNPSVYSLRCSANHRWNANTDLLCTNCRTKCPPSIPNGTVSFGCSRTFRSYCSSYVCYNGCPGSTRSIYCDGDGDWSDGYAACSCTNKSTTSASNRCPSWIPNGHISYGCERSPGSVCDFFCNSGCYSYDYSYSLTCSQYGYWYGENSACQCQERTTTFATEESQNSHGLPIAIGCVAGILFIGTVVAMWGCYRRRRPKGRATTAVELDNLGHNNGRTYSGTTTQSAQSGVAISGTVTTIPTLHANINPTAQAVEGTIHTEDPPMYSTLFPSNQEPSLFPSNPEPSPVLPSYEEVAAHL